jgi:hypothetical protein
VQEILNIEPWLSITSTLYCYEEYKPIDGEDDRHINRIEVEEKDGDTELVKPVNQYIAPLTLEFKVTSVDDQYECNDLAYSCKHSALSVDELEIEKKIHIQV